MPAHTKRITDVAHFHGPWTTSDVHVVAAVLAVLEEHLNNPPMPYSWMPPWVVVATKEPPESRLYLARRCGNNKGVCARSVGELVDLLRRSLNTAK